MAYTEVETVGWSKRMKSSIGGVLVGIGMVLGGTALLWWNEGNFVLTRDALDEAKTVTVEMGDVNVVDASKNGKLVHASGPVETADILEDPDFGVATNAIRLVRDVEYYQWVEDSETETRTSYGGKEERVTTYTYAKRWVSGPVDSSGFHDPSARRQHRNSVLARYDQFAKQAANVSFGAYRLPGFLVDAITGSEELKPDIPEAVAERLRNQLAPSSGNAAPLPAPAPANPADAAAAAPATIDGNTITIDAGEGGPLALEEAAAASTAAAPASPPMLHIGRSSLYLGLDPNNWRIGDLRISFSRVLPGTASILAQVNGDTFEAFRASNGKTVSRLSMGVHSLENMYGDSHAENTTSTWVLRLVGAGLVIFGLMMAMAPLKVLASVIPPLATIVGAGTGIVGFLLGGAWSLLVIAVAWLRFRPLVGIVILALAIGLLWLLFRRGRSQGQGPAPEA